MKNLSKKNLFVQKTYHITREIDVMPYMHHNTLNLIDVILNLNKNIKYLSRRDYNISISLTFKIKLLT